MSRLSHAVGVGLAGLMVVSLASPSSAWVDDWLSVTDSVETTRCLIVPSKIVVTVKTTSQLGYSASLGAKSQTKINWVKSKGPVKAGTLRVRAPKSGRGLVVTVRGRERKTGDRFACYFDLWHEQKTFRGGFV